MRARGARLARLLGSAAACKPSRRALLITALIALCGSAGLAAATWAAIEPAPVRLGPAPGDVVRSRIVDRHGDTVSLTYDNPWNVHDVVALYEVPEVLREAFVEAEDRRFFDHGGVDWTARGHAVLQNLLARRGVRGASTITEQVVRMHRPRPRTIWARWLEGFEAQGLERRFSKGEILEAYLNQVPYARRRRGVAQAARDYFDRDLSTLSPKEMLALAVLVRAPSALDLRKSTERVERRIARLADRLRERGVLTREEGRLIESSRLELRPGQLPVVAPHFATWVRGRTAARPSQSTARGTIRTTLDGALQRQVTAMLEAQLTGLSARRVTDGAALVVDHRENEILAWVNAGGFDATEPGSQIDAVVTPRQPGSTLKPFVFAAAMEQGWTAATLVEDSPLRSAVGSGIHEYRNYSRHHYGPLRVREALGNSLNVPAVRAIQSVTPQVVLTRLHELGFESLDRPPHVYGDGLALGNGEVTLYELVAAYSVLARGGMSAPLGAAEHEPQHGGRRVMSEEIASILADILSDAGARRLEFGSGGVLEMPLPTAVKTGTSNDYRDAWAIGFSDRHTVGVWMGNLDRHEMDGVSGAAGPALTLRAVFAELRRRGDDRVPRMARSLRRSSICALSGALATGACPSIEEWFREEHEPVHACPLHAPLEPGDSRGEDAGGVAPGRSARLVQPTPGLHLAMDPRIPDELEAFGFRVAVEDDPRSVEWIVDGQLTARTTGASYAWPLSPGRHTVRARVFVDRAEPLDTRTVTFLVK